MNKLLAATYEKAKAEGRLCTQCGWIITKANWKKGYRLCAGCGDANKGVRTRPVFGKWRDEPVDMTGEMP
jgi:hypothetical protein